MNSHYLHPVCAGLLGISAACWPADAAPAISYRLANHSGRQVIESSAGEVIPWTCYSLGPDLSVENWSQKQTGFIAQGVHLFQLPLQAEKGQYWDNIFFSPDGQSLAEPLVPINWPKQVAWLLEHDPQAHFIMRFGLNTGLAWRQEHRDQLQPLPKGMGAFRDGYSVLPSLASDLYRERTGRLIRDAVAWCERQPWRDRVVGYTFFPYCEGATEVGVFGQTFDTSPVMQQAFRDFARQKYGTDEALQKAWGDPAVRLETVAVPTKQEWLEKRGRLRLLHWPDPDQVQRERDYFLLQKQLFHRYWGEILDTMNTATAARPVIKGYDTFKQHMQGWLHNPNFDSDWQPGVLDEYGSILLASGSIGVGPLLDRAGLDLLQTPGMYYNRAMGYAWEAEGLSDSLILRGKLNMMESDMRTWVNRDVRGKPFPPDKLINDAGTFLTPPEMAAGFDRTLAWALSRNQMYYFASVCGANWWFEDPAIFKKIGEERALIERSLNWPWQNTTDAICLVVDDESALDEDSSSGFQYLAVYRQIEEGLALCGVPYRIHLLSDLAKENFPDYKCYLFPNLFKVEADIEALLRKKIFRNGHVAIFGPATGITDGRKLSAAAATRLFGIPMELVPKSSARRVILQDHGHPLSQRLETVTYGDSYAYGPLLVPTTQRLPEKESNARPLGAAFYYYFFDRPGIFVNDFGRGAVHSDNDATRGAGDYSIVFSPAVPLPPELLRECARYAGCNVWSEKNAVIEASGNFVALHTVKTGDYVIQLPRPSEVWDLNLNRRLSLSTDRITGSTQAPATLLFFLGTTNQPSSHKSR